VSNPLDRSAAFTALLDLDPEGFGKSDLQESGATITRFLAAFDQSGQGSMYDFAKTWIGFDQRTTEGIGLHARDWAFNGMRSSYEEAQAYGKHVEHLYRTGELRELDSHKDLFPAFRARRELDHPTDPELEA